MCLKLEPDTEKKFLSVSDILGGGLPQKAPQLSLTTSTAARRASAPKCLGGGIGLALAKKWWKGMAADFGPKVKSAKGRP